MAEQETHAVKWHEVRLTVKRDADPAAMFAAVEPPPDVWEGEAPIWADRPDTLLRRLLAWGWGSDYDFHDGRTQVPRWLGVYYDWTQIEDDERLMPRLAPFIEAGSRAVFEVSKDTERHEFWGQDFEAWEFDGTTVERRSVEKRVEFL